MTFVIRSMSTTDAVPAFRRGTYFQPAQQPQRYHIYLRANRASAWWGGKHEAMRFETEEEANAFVAARAGSLSNVQVAPLDDHAIPPFWAR